MYIGLAIKTMSVRPPALAGWSDQWVAEQCPAKSMGSAKVRKSFSILKHKHDTWFIRHQRSGSSVPLNPHWRDHGSIHGLNTAGPGLVTVVGSAYFNLLCGGKVSLMYLRNSIVVSCSLKNRTSKCVKSHWLNNSHMPNSKLDPCWKSESQSTSGDSRAHHRFVSSAHAIKHVKF